jgi:hypothetical protein
MNNFGDDSRTSWGLDRKGSGKSLSQRQVKEWMGTGLRDDIPDQRRGMTGDAACNQNGNFEDKMKITSVIIESGLIYIRFTLSHYSGISFISTR